MMKNNSYFYVENRGMVRLVAIISVLAVILGGCTSRRMARQASNLESAGMYRDAAELYYKAYVSRPQRVEYRIGLKRNGQLYVDECAQIISQAFYRGDHRKVVYDYLSLQGFIEMVKNAGVELHTDANVSQLFEISRNKYLSERYEEALRLMNEKQYQQARQIFSEIHRINPNYENVTAFLNITTFEPLYQNGLQLFAQKKYIEAYREWEKIALENPNYKDVNQLMQQALAERYREGSFWLLQEKFDAAAVALGDVFKINPDYHDVRNLYREARNEPVYRNAVRHLKNGKCRAAYFDFEKIIKDAGNYKDSHLQLEEALKCARFPVAVSYIGAGKIADDLEALENTLFSKILDQKDPFLQLHRLSVVNQSIDRNIRTTGEIPPQPRLKELLDKHHIKALLIITFHEYEKTEGPLEKTERTGFEQQRRTTSSGETTYHYQKVKYYEYQKRNEVTVSLTYQLIATPNGQILISRKIADFQTDQVHYASYDGDPKNLYPATKTENSWVPYEAGYSSLQRLLRAPNRIASTQQLRNKLFIEVSDKIAQALINFNPEQ